MSSTPDNRATTDTLARLIGPDGTLHSYPGPVLLLDSENRIVVSNPAAAGLSHGILTGTATAVLALAEAARAGTPGGKRIVDPDSGEITDLVALPAGDGTHALLTGRDISLDQSLRDALVDSRQRYKDLVEVSSDFAWETDADGRFAFVSPLGVLGHAPEILVGQPSSRFVAQIEGIDQIAPFTTRERLSEIEFNFRAADGSVATLVGSATPIFDAEGRWRGARGVCRDITEQRRAEAAHAEVRDRERLLGFITRAIRDEVDPLDMLDKAATVIARALAADGCLLVRRDVMSGDRPVSGAVFGTLPEGVSADLIQIEKEAPDAPRTAEIGTVRLLLVETSHHQSVNGGLVLWRGAGRPSWSTEEIGQLGRIAPQIAIALAQVAAHLELERLSSTDMLTGLYNRRSFTDKLGARVTGDSPFANQPGALAYVDLDNFKQVNDLLGHQEGDDALVAVSSMLKKQARDGDIVTRLGGDEFAIWLERADETTARARGEELMTASMEMRDAYSPNPEKPFGLSVGIACLDPGSGETLDQLVARADGAMYEIKKGGKSSLAVAAPFQAGEELENDAD